MATTYIQGARHLETGGADTIYGSIANSDWPGRRVRDVTNEIALLDANNSALITLLMKLRTKATQSTKLEWQEDVFPVQKITIGEGVSSTETTVTVSSSDADLVRMGDVFWYAENDEVVYVSTVGSTTIVFERGIGDTDLTDWDSGDTLFYVGNAQEMGDQARAQLTTQISMPYNYCQLFKESYEVDNTANLEKLYGGPDMVYLRRKHGEIHKKDIERAFWWGERDLRTASDATGTYPRTSGAYMTRGILRWLLDSSNGGNIHTNASGALTEDEFNTYLEEDGEYGNNRKFAFCSPRALTVISSWGRDKLQVVPSDTTFGINITRYISPHVELNLINNKLFAKLSDSGSSYDPATSCIILDLEQLWYRTFRSTKLELNIQENDRDAVQEQYLTEVGLEFHLPLHHSGIFGWALS